MEAIFHPTTYEMIGDIEKMENGLGWFATVIDGEENYNQLAEGFFKTKRAASSWVYRQFKRLNPNYNKQLISNKK
jgi:hypothetical protein